MWATTADLAKQEGVSMATILCQIALIKYDAYKIGDVWRVWLNDDKFFADRDDVDMPSSLIEAIERELDDVILLEDLAKFLKMSAQFFGSKRHIYAIPMHFIDMEGFSEPRLGMYRNDLILWLNSVSNLNIDEDVI